MSKCIIYEIPLKAIAMHKQIAERQNQIIVGPMSKLASFVKYLNRNSFMLNQLLIILKRQFCAKSLKYFCPSCISPFKANSIFRKQFIQTEHHCSKYGIILSRVHIQLSYRAIFFPRTLRFDHESRQTLQEKLIIRLPKHK